VNQGFDISSNATVLAALQARCDQTYPNMNGVFQLAQNNTTRVRGDSIYQRSLMPVTNLRVAIAWSAVYRMRVLVGTLIVVDSTMVDLAIAMILTEAQTQLDAVDMRYVASGFSTAYAPLLAP